MKKHTISTLGLVAVLGIGAVVYTQRTPPVESASLPTEPAVNLPPDETPLPEPEIVIKTTPASVVVKKEPEPEPEPVVMAPTVPQPEPVAPKPQLTKEERRQQAMDRYWDKMARNFDRKLNQLDREQNPDRRLDLIQSIARYVRVDTVATLEWAATLTDPDEQRAALNAINQNALTGIGARIDTDETGLPYIRKTTILSAVESTGMVEAGDYISGMVNPDGSQVYFKDWPLQKVAQVLRGEPGTEVQLMIERVTPDGVWYSFDVPVQRSLIVMEPQF
ncbi:hypothetical protein P4C99_06000 [Pontiellaceae bacterium B1224]|nr:hypothetical protein [Pontiellaceae bacterium B1224]